MKATRGMWIAVAGALACGAIAVWDVLHRLWAGAVVGAAFAAVLMCAVFWQRRTMIAMDQAQWRIAAAVRRHEQRKRGEG